MKKENDEKVKDIDICMEKIRQILKEYNCEIQTDDYHNAWLHDNDTGITLGNFNT